MVEQKKQNLSDPKVRICVILLTTIVLGYFLKQRKGDNGALALDGYERVLLRASWTYNYKDVEEVARNSDIIAVVKVISATPSDKYLQYGVMQTIYTVQVIDDIYGGIGNEIQIVMTGGVSEEEKKIYEIADDPLMNIDDEYVIFAKENPDGSYTALSGFQGRYAVTDGYVSSLNVSNEQVAAPNAYSDISVTNIALDDFVGQVRQYIAFVE